MRRHILTYLIGCQYVVVFKKDRIVADRKFYDRMDDMTWDVSSFLGGVDLQDPDGDESESRIGSAMLHGTEG